MAKKRTDLSKLKALSASLKKNTYIPEYYKKQLMSVVQECLEYDLKKPSVEQSVSTKFYRNNLSHSLMSGDIIDLKKLDEELSKEHQSTLGEKTFSEYFYPYFFKNYEYGVVVTQACKLEHGKTHVVEICAVKPITKVVHNLLSTKSISARDKFIYDESEIPNLATKYRKLIDQQEDEFFFYPAWYKNNKLLAPPIVACIDIKIPLRCKINGKDNLDILKRCRTQGIDPIFQAKLGEKLGRYYLNVALEDTSELFKDTNSEFGQWVESTLRALLPFKRPDMKKSKESIRKFIKDNFDKDLDINEIWDNPDSMEIILNFAKED